jgi:hypothetical protein
MVYLSYRIAFLVTTSNYLFLFIYLKSLCFLNSQLDEPESTASTMKRSVSSFLGQVSSVLNPSPEDDDEEAIVIHDSEPVVLTKYQVVYSINYLHQHIS